jgi:hypothetical protein
MAAPGTVTSELDDRNSRRAVVENEGRCRAGGQLLDDRLRDRGHLGVGGADIDIGLEEDLDDPDAVIRVGGNVFDIVDGRRQDALKLRGDAAGHLIRRQAGILPDHADHGNADFRKDVGGGAQSGQRADDQQEQREHHESIWPTQRDTDQCCHRAGIP